MVVYVIWIFASQLCSQLPFSDSSAGYLLLQSWNNPLLLKRFRVRKNCSTSMIVRQQHSSDRVDVSPTASGGLQFIIPNPRFYATIIILSNPKIWNINLKNVNGTKLYEGPFLVLITTFHDEVLVFLYPIPTSDKKMQFILICR